MEKTTFILDGDELTFFLPYKYKNIINEALNNKVSLKIKFLDENKTEINNLISKYEDIIEKLKNVGCVG